LPLIEHGIQHTSKYYTVMLCIDEVHLSLSESMFGPYG